MNFSPPFVTLLCAYLLGSIPTGYWLVKWLKGVDVRTVGSGNIGATNTVRAAGKGVGAAVFLIDMAKGLIPALAFAGLFGHAPTGVFRLACGSAAVIGHCFPLFLGFRGGKGVATAVGALFGTSPVLGVVFVAVWLLSTLVWRYVSVGSMAAAASIPAALALLGASRMELLIGAGLALLIIARHQANIQRLMQGKEPKAIAKRTEG